jgi:hypothetical protein
VEVVISKRRPTGSEAGLLNHPPHLNPLWKIVERGVVTLE